MVLPAISLAEGKQVAEQLRSAVADHTVALEGKNSLAVTISVGLAEAQAVDNATLLVRRADSALYAAKNAGRDCCYFHSGRDCQPIRCSRRRAFHQTVRIAPHVEGTLPDASAFQEVQTEDISESGISYFLPAPPTYKAVIVELKTPGSLVYMDGIVRNVRNLGTETKPTFRIGCQFTSRLGIRRLSTSVDTTHRSKEADEVTVAETGRGTPAELR